jgi:DNA (cytosine-5)-methyltransferase 1
MESYLTRFRPTAIILSVSTRITPTNRLDMADIYRLKEAAQLVGVSPITLKRWFLSRRIPDVSRDRNGWRVFTDPDIRRIRSFARSSPMQTDAGSAIQSFTPWLSAVSLFSGIGGFELGFERAGFSTVFQCEIDRFCLDILHQHWPLTPRATDIRTLTNAEIPTADVWLGGFPCQDVSLARMGTRAGLKGRQSGLFHEFARLVGKGRPPAIVLENVPGLLNSHKGRDFATIIGALAKLGYSVAWRTLNSKDFGVPQSRQRVYIVGCHRDPKGPAEILFESECRQGDAPPRKSHGKAPLSPFKKIIGDPGGKGPVFQSIAYCLYACAGRHTGTDWSRTYVCYPRSGRVRRLTPDECEGVMAFPRGWTIPRSAHIDPSDLDSLRYHALGNAVTPPVAEWLGHRIALYLTRRRMQSVTSNHTSQDLAAQ